MIDLFGDQILDKAYLHKLRISMRGAIDLRGGARTNGNTSGKCL